MAAMREGVGLPHRSGRTRAIIAALVAAAGLAAILAGLFGGADGGNAAGLLGIGAALMFLGVALFSPQLIRPLAHVVGAPFQRFWRILKRGHHGRRRRQSLGLDHRRRQRRARRGWFCKYFGQHGNTGIESGIVAHDCPATKWVSG